MQMFIFPILSLFIGYPKTLATGMICASGTLGQIIPPSLVLILLAEILGESVGTMFAAAMVPGLTLAAVYIIAILVIAKLYPHLMPPSPLRSVKRWGDANC